MKKMKLISVLLGMSLVFGGVFSVSAKVKKLNSKDLKMLDELKKGDFKRTIGEIKNNNKKYKVLDNSKKSSTAATKNEAKLKDLKILDELNKGDFEKTKAKKKYKVLDNSKELSTEASESEAELKESRKNGKNSKPIDSYIIEKNEIPQDTGLEVYGQFDYFFNDGSMNKKYYGKQQNEAKEIQPGNEGQFDNETNTNHVLAFCAIFREGVRQVLVDFLNEKGFKLPENCKLEELIKKLSTKAGVNITGKDIETILLYFGMCCTHPNKNHDGEFSLFGTQFFNVRKEAYDFLKRVFKKIKNIKLTNKMVKDGQQYAIEVVNSELKDRNKRKKEIIKYEDRGYFEFYNNNFLMDIVRKFQHANLKRVKDACDVFECKEELRDERVRDRSESKG